METSEKRKERLKAMRVEAEEAEACDNGSSAVPGYLSNPLAEDNAAVQEEPCAPCRFGYYTDPMAAFSSGTKRSKVGDQIASNSFIHSNTGASAMARFPSPLSGIARNPEMTPQPHQFQSNYSPDQRMYQQNFGPQRSPIGLARPFPMHHGNPPQVWNRAEGRFPGPRFRPRGSPGFGPPASDRQLGPEQFYNASMVEENPWKGLPPVSWKGVDAISYCGSNRHSYGSTNRPSYGSTNNASFSEGSNKSAPQPNLAEYLAASCNETINEALTS